MLLTAAILVFLLAIALRPDRPRLTFEQRWELVKFIVNRTRGA